MSFYDRVFREHVFPNLPSFGMALGLFAFNLTLFCLFLILRAVNFIPDPVTQLSGVGRIEDAQSLLVLSAFWSIGNILLLLGFVDALRDAGKPAAQI